MKSDKGRGPEVLLGFGNTKLGPIHTFTLPAGDTCPGQSELCAKHCYAKRGTIRLQQDRGTYHKNLELAECADFVSRMADEIRFRQVMVVRIHPSGDFFSEKYVRKWIEIAKLRPQARFFAYTRSWRVRDIRPALNEFSKLPNVRLWYSCDKETGLPASVGKNVRLAYMAVDDDDVPERRPDLAFRVKRKTVVKKMGPTLVCPSENGITDTTCDKCGVCWKPLAEKDARRIALAVL